MLLGKSRAATLQRDSAFSTASVDASLCEARERGIAALTPPTGRRLQGAAMLGEKPKNAFLLGLADSALVDEPGDQLPRRNIESEICRGAALGRDAHLHLLAFVQSVGVIHFFGA